MERDFSETSLAKYFLTTIPINSIETSSRQGQHFMEKFGKTINWTWDPRIPSPAPYQLNYQYLTEWLALFIINILSWKKFFGKQLLWQDQDLNPGLSFVHYGYGYEV